jgi:hypothetical protein
MVVQELLAAVVAVVEQRAAMAAMAVLKLFGHRHPTQRLLGREVVQAVELKAALAGMAA